MNAIEPACPGQLDGIMAGFDAIPLKPHPTRRLEQLPTPTSDVQQPAACNAGMLDQPFDISLAVDSYTMLGLGRYV